MASPAFTAMVFEAGGSHVLAAWKVSADPGSARGSAKGKGFSDTAGVANFSVLYPPTPAAQWCFPTRGLAAVAAKASAAAGGQGS